MFTSFAPDIILMGGVTILLVLGVLNPQEALSGFSNQGMITVALLFVVAQGLSQTGVRLGLLAVYWDTLLALVWRNYGLCYQLPRLVQLSITRRLSR